MGHKPNTPFSRPVALPTLMLALIVLAGTVACAGGLNHPDSAVNSVPPRWNANAAPALSGSLAPGLTYNGNSGLPAGAVTVTEPGVEVSTDLDDYDSGPVSSIPDPLEPWNRFWFSFNDIFYIHVARPLYNGWTYITPDDLRAGLSNLFHNALFPTRFINCLLQLRFMDAGVEFSRFMMNMMGTAGLGNPARNKKTIVPVDPSGEDFGQTLGRWGIGHGFYIVWPFIGPSSLRDSIGLAGNWFTNPIYYLQPWTLSWGTEIGLQFNDVGEILPSYTSLKSFAIDPYIAMREAYVSMRRGQVLR